MLMCRPERPEDDPLYWKPMFKGRERRLELQVQGRFKHRMESMVYIGGELSQRMQLGLITRSLLRLVLTFLKNFHSSIHCSFGDKANAQLPHVVCPLWQSADRMYVTRPGEDPPALGQNIPETDAARAARKASDPRGNWDPDNIYTFTLNTAIVDLPNWQIVDVPMLRAPLNLATFVGDASVRARRRPCLYRCSRRDLGA